MKVISFLSGFVSEDNGKTSNKRLGSFFLLFLIYKMVNAHLIGVNVSVEFFQTIVGLYAVSVGLITIGKNKLTNITQNILKNGNKEEKNNSKEKA